jgi:hypothetical protein
LHLLFITPDHFLPFIARSNCGIIRNPIILPKIQEMGSASLGGDAIAGSKGLYCRFKRWEQVAVAAFQPSGAASVGVHAW